jgi:hypothetical protein
MKKKFSDFGGKAGEGNLWLAPVPQWDLKHGQIDLEV